MPNDDRLSLGAEHGELTTEAINIGLQVLERRETPAPNRLQNGFLHGETARDVFLGLMLKLWQRERGFGEQERG